MSTGTVPRWEDLRKVGDLLDDTNRMVTVLDWLMDRIEGWEMDLGIYLKNESEVRRGIWGDLVPEGHELLVEHEVLGFVSLKIPDALRALVDEMKTIVEPLVDAAYRAASGRATEDDRRAARDLKR